MPKFPNYPVDWPTVLNPLAPRHYWTLLKWVFFQPNGLKRYLHHADAELYNSYLDPWLRSRRFPPSYRNVFLMNWVLSIFLPVILTVGLSIILGRAPNWTTLSIGALFGLGLGMVLGIIVGGALGGVVRGLIFTTTILMISFSTLFGVALGVDWSLTYSNFTLVGGIGLGMTFSLVFSIAWGQARGVLSGASFALVGLLLGPAPAIGILLGATRAPLWLIELPWAIWLSYRQKRTSKPLQTHPIMWDVFIVWPLLGVSSLLRTRLWANFEQNHDLLANTAANPFQRWSVQRALADVFVKDSQPLNLLYRLLHTPYMDDYLWMPASRNQAESWPSLQVVLIGEMAQVFVDGTGGYNESLERVVWQGTRFLRCKNSTPLTRFCGMLYVLLQDSAHAEKIDLHHIRLAQRFSDAYEDVRIYPHGDEVANSWASLAILREMTALEQIGVAHEQLTWIPLLKRPYLAPEVIGALTALGDVSQSVAVCLRATSLSNKTVALNQAAGSLNELQGYVEKELWPPERTLYLALVKNWQSLVAAEQGRLGESALRQMSPGERLATGLVERTSDVWQRPAKPLANPYIAGDPVMPPLFVGRRDIFTKIAEIWRAKANPDSIILYGHRRMGKSSILRNLDQAAPGRVIAYVNLQGETSFIASTSDLLLALADRIYAEVKRARPKTALTQPPSDQFTTQFAAQTQFNRFMEQVRTALGNSGLILALDEFEAIEEAVRDGKVGKEIYQFLRAKTQEPWITVVFGGLHTLDEMSRDYAQPFYGSYQNIVVSYLAPEDAYHLITNPTPDFAVNYEPAAVDRIIAATGGQPYLVQLVCRDALDHLNHELFDEHKEREVKLTLADVDAVLGDDLFRRGTGYFDGVWTQVSEAAQQDLLRCTAQREEAWTLTELEAVTHLAPDELHHHLQLAQRRDILRQRDDGTWELCVPLMRQWIIWKE
jgi:hypothetical protein